MHPKLLEAKDLADDAPDEAMRLCNDALAEDFDDCRALFMIGYMMLQAERFGLAYNIMKRCAQLNPGQSEIYNNMGMCLEYERPKQAMECFDKALALKSDNVHAMINKGLMHLKRAEPAKCVELCTKALKIDPHSIAARDNRAQALLMLRQWAEGWDDYQYSLGGKHRKKRDYGVPEWNGQKGVTVVVYGEQGIGDEILFASCIPDLMRDCKVIIDCDHRLEGLFRRSFDCDVFGTRFKEASPIVDMQIDYACSVGDLPRFYRRSEDAFPGGAYLTPDPERVIQWRALLESLPGRKIGIAWTGGLPNTEKKTRSFDLQTFAPLFDMGDTLISLEYNTPDLTGTPVIHWDRAVKRGVDFDETMALIACLDMVVCVTTTAVHAAGAIGKECWCLVPSNPSFRFHLEGNMPWHDSVRLIRQDRGEDWINVVERVKAELC